MNFDLIRPTIRRERPQLSFEDALEQASLKGIGAFESIKWVSNFDAVQIHKLKAMADLFRLLNNIVPKEQGLIDEIYEKIRQKMVINYVNNRTE